MINLNYPIFCHECKNILDDVEELLFVENKCLRGFCSESCIEDFYRPIMGHFETLIHELKIKHNCSEENFDISKSEQELIDEVSNRPDEVYRLLNDLDDELFVFIKYHFRIYSIVICTMNNNSPAFIFSYVKTANNQLVDDFRVGEKIDPFVNTDIDSNAQYLSDEQVQFFEEVENKKSMILSELLMILKDSDIGIEKFHLYDHFLNISLNAPDEIFEKKDRDGDRITYFLKTILDNKLGNFFYIVATIKKIDHGVEGSEVFIPIIAFPTIDPDVFEFYRSGERLHGLLKN